MKHDYEKLYPFLANGNQVLVEHDGGFYRFQFQGDKIGTENYLLVTSPEEKKLRFGWGWDHWQLMRALKHLEKGWDAPQEPAFALYNRGSD